MKILSIDTASKICSVAILENEKIMDEINLDDGRTHSENLMPIVSEILQKNHLNLSDIDLLSCCTGPGSFTGIRIGVASVKAMAEVNHLPIASVTSLETLARLDTSEKNKVALIDARNNQVYCGIFNAQYQPMQDLFADDIKEVIAILKQYNNMICIGDGAVLHREILKQEIPDLAFSVENEQKASCGGLLAYQKQDLKNADNLVPIYLRKSQAERMKAKK